jgi:RNA polymerase sigma-70 factor (ECF subfamily)
MNSADEFEVIVSEHYEPLFRFAMSLTRAESDARDLTQQTFYVWATKRHQLRDISKVKTWLFTTLHRMFLQIRRRHIRFPHHELEKMVEELPPHFSECAVRLDCSRALSALAGLDDVYKAAVALFYLEDCSYKDIAFILDVPIGTVKSRISRGIVQLRELLLSWRGLSAPERQYSNEDNANAIGRQGEVGRQVGRDLEDEGDDLRVRFDLKPCEWQAERDAETEPDRVGAGENLHAPHQVVAT